jgi:hypothetical protein
VKVYLNIFISIFLLNSCFHENSQSIPKELNSYVEDFFSDAIDNGINIKLEDFSLDISFTNLPESDGRCFFHGNKVLIDSIFWRNANSLRRKWLIYHELGHCVLDRRHYDETFINGECKSIMRENYDCSENLVSQKWNEYYLKELFVHNENLPYWYNLNEIPSTFYSTNYEKLDTVLLVEKDLERTLDLNYRFKLDPNKDFQISITYNNRPVGIVPKIRTEDFNFSVYTRGMEITLRYDDSSPNSLHEIYSNKQEMLATDIVLKVKYKNGILFFFVNDKLVHSSDYSFEKSISIYNLNFKYDTPISIEAGNI